MQQVAKAKKRRGGTKTAKFSTGRRAGASKRAKAKTLKLPLGVALQFYRPLKKPVTLRLDADVLAWFKRDGKRYQTRINAALRRVMELELRRR